MREKIGRIEGISKLEAGSDADSYVPTFKKSPVKSPMHHPGHYPGHKPVRKSNSNPNSEEGSSSKPALQHKHVERKPRLWQPSYHLVHQHWGQPQRGLGP